MGQPLLQKFISLPTFLLAIFLLYWSLPICVLVGTLKLLDFTFPRTDMYNWCQFMTKLFRIKIKKYGPNGLRKDTGRHILYLCNHRSWTDFFLDAYLTEGNGSLMSRWLVFAVFPVFMVAVIVLRGVILFKRGTVLDKEKFNEWLDSKVSSSPIPGMLVYPEGHRSLAHKSLPLKRGMLYYAHSRKFPVQIIISRNKEEVLSEKTMKAHFGATIVTGFSELIESEGKDIKEFLSEVQTAWDKMWDSVYSADAAALPELEHTDVPKFDYSFSMRVMQLLVVSGTVVVFLGTMAAMVKCVCVCLAATGDLGCKVLVSSLVGWFLVSILNSRAPSGK
ncbi:hypothetical protein DUNSADRAFT_2030 [Dunaliella salina]|uniref:Phospholipid/glycerol acyltransferase domain-containing protein n=1 Tax=Dunaliella salina TaxID=3046 RepID=A0ABQ7GW71_DUNSA|nr:hypothetical protein DUNSADRAFT_2030 [Dunaliella salina]|eukprot:KAF5838861.1 hypothetical protein DUNSADRAFT_2030 [Dunaliella salina]